MLFRRIRQIVAIGAALGFAQGGWESCDAVFAQFGSAATRLGTVVTNRGQPDCPQALVSLVGSRIRCNLRYACTSRIAEHTVWEEQEPVAHHDQLPEAHPTAVDARVASEDGPQRRVAESTRSAPRRPSTQAPNPQAVPQPISAVPQPISAERIANAQASVDGRVAERIAREQAARDRVAAERIARQQESANYRAVERIVREQTAINRRESARIAMGQAARDRLAIERIRTRQAVANRVAIEAILKRRGIASRGVAGSTGKRRNATSR